MFHKYPYSLLGTLSRTRSYKVAHVNLVFVDLNQGYLDETTMLTYVQQITAEPPYLRMKITTKKYSAALSLISWSKLFSYWSPAVYMVSWTASYSFIMCMLSIKRLNNWATITVRAKCFWSQIIPNQGSADLSKELSHSRALWLPPGTPWV